MLKINNVYSEALLLARVELVWGESRKGGLLGAGK